jgi:hypothetical protein
MPRENPHWRKAAFEPYIALSLYSNPPSPPPIPTPGSAVQSNRFICRHAPHARPSNFGSASDKRYSLGILKEGFLRGTTAIAACTLLVGAANAQSADPRLVGRWYGEFDKAGPIHCWLSDRKEDGTYRTDFITLEDGVFNSYYQQGIWTAAGQSFTTIIQSEDNKPTPPTRAQYSVISIRADVLVYRHDQSGTRFTVRRVETNFRMPARCGS